MSYFVMYEGEKFNGKSFIIGIFHKVVFTHDKKMIVMFYITGAEMLQLKLLVTCHQERNEIVPKL